MGFFGEAIQANSTARATMERVANGSSKHGSEFCSVPILALDRRRPDLSR